MTSSVDYSPKPIFSLADTGRETPPVGLIAPGRYVQGPRLLDHLDRFLALLPSARPAIFISDGGLRRHGEQLLDGLRDAQIEATVEIFQGECSLSEIDRAVASLQERQPRAHSGGQPRAAFRQPDRGRRRQMPGRRQMRCGPAGRAGGHLPHDRLHRRALLCSVGDLLRRRDRPGRRIFP